MKALLIVLVALASIGTASAQGFFQHRALPTSLRFGLTAGDSSTTVIPTVQNVFHPVVNVASYAITKAGQTLLTGGGVSYQHEKFNNASKAWDIQYSFNALVWYSVGVGGVTQNRFAYGVAVGVLNNLLLVGGATDGQHVYFTLGIGLNPF